LPDGYETSVYIHRPSEPAGLPVLYAHGIQSHPGWFFASAAHLAERGHAVFQVTRRGSGDSPQRRGDAKSAVQLLEDIDAACAFVLRQTGADRLHLLGVSWGGKLLAAYACARSRAPNLASLVLVAPGIVPRVDISPLAKLKVAAVLLLKPTRLFDIPLNDVALFTDNESMRGYLRRDSFRLHKATARFLYASRRLDRMLARCPRGRLSVPTTLILAERDRIIDSAATKGAVDRLTAGSVVTREFDGAHTLEFEADPAPFFQALAGALDRAEGEGPAR
jgi:alpha-beta hydrolase superfamily lysophospholipase